MMFNSQMHCSLIKGGIVSLWASLLLGLGSPSGGFAANGYDHDPLAGSNTPATLVPATNATVLPPSATGYTLDEKHVLREGDQISFQIIEDRDPAINLVVTDSGEVEVPYLGRVSCAGKTCKQLAEELKVPLEKEYYYRATVVIGLNAVSKTRGRVYIWGEVRKQGPVEIPAAEKFTVGKAIMQAGGFADFANKRKVKLVHTEADGTKTTKELDLVDILEKGKTDQDLPVEEDDFIIVPSRLINF